VIERRVAGGAEQDGISAKRGGERLFGQRGSFCRSAAPANSLEVNVQVCPN
jgi:hypothetical protein